MTNFWWIIPTIITVACVVWVFFDFVKVGRIHPVDVLVGGIAKFVQVCIAIIICLVVWLIWALLR